MQTSILMMMLALGLPGANSCNTQQPLPRVAQTAGPGQAVAKVQDAPKPAVEDSDADEDMDEIAEVDDGDDGDDAAEAFEMDEVPEMDEADEADASFEMEEMAQDCGTGGGCCDEAKTAPAPALTLRNGTGVQTLTIEPGSTVILQTRDGKRVKLDTQHLALGNEQVAGMAGTQAMSSLAGLARLAPQMRSSNQDNRVRELEQRVRELEAQLRERDGQNQTPSARTFLRFGQQSHELGRQERARADELRQRMGEQARELAEHAREQAQSMREQAQVYRRQAQDQAQQWRKQIEEGASGGAWIFPAPPDAPAGAAPAVPPEAPQPGSVWSLAPLPNGAGVPSAPRAFALRTPRTPQAAATPTPSAPEHVQEMKSLLDDMRKQMDEMREQMRELREELQNAPQREMR
ncbi:MAG: hypothetical protein IPJ19_08245 [Planctomycetes bacterium]|nr:hypothetical protein [Planctomycetota bacterium]